MTIISSLKLKSEEWNGGVSGGSVWIQKGQLAKDISYAN
jgi:hypothetical protein